MKDLPVVVGMVGDMTLAESWSKAKRAEEEAGRVTVILDKVASSDCVLVVTDESGAITESTGHQVAAAIKAGKVVRWLHPAAKANYFGLDAPSKVDERTWWEFASDGCAHVNDQWFGFLGNPHAEVLTDAMTATHRLHFLAWDSGKTTIEPNQALSKKDAIHAMEEVYSNHRGWARAGLKTYLGDTLAEAKAKHARKAQQGAEVAA